MKLRIERVNEEGLLENLCSLLELLLAFVNIREALRGRGEPRADLERLLQGLFLARSF